MSPLEAVVVERTQAGSSPRAIAALRDTAEGVAHVGSFRRDLDPTSPHVTWSQGMYALFDVDPAEFHGDPLPILAARVHPDDRARVRQAAEAVAASGVPAPVEFRVVHRDGSEIIVYSEAAVERDAAGTPVAIIGYYQDVSERRRLEATLRESVALRDASEHVARVASFRWDFTTPRPTWSAEVYALLDMSIGEFDGDVLRALDGRVHPADRQALQRDIDAVAERGTLGPLDFRVVHRDGTEHVLHSEGSAERDAAGRVTALVGFLQDVTEQQESERRYRSLFEDSPVAMWEEDHAAVKAHLVELVAAGVEDVARYLHEHPAEYRRCVELACTLDVNHAAVALFEAASRVQLLERQHEVCAPGVTGGLPVFWAGLLAGQRAASYEEVNLTLAGRELRVLETASVAPGHEDDWSRVYLADVDVSERRRAEAELARTSARLAGALKATVATLGTTIELRDPYTAGHQRRVAELACAIAAELGWTDASIEPLRTAARLHDIGKILVPAEILTKPGKLSADEFLLVRQHAQAGADILADIDFGGDIAGMVRQHHERLDGSGYPDGLRDGEILAEARVLAVADVVEAMASHRPYRAALPLEAALAEIEDGAGIRYDADVVAACERVLAGGFAFPES